MIEVKQFDRVFKQDWLKEHHEISWKKLLKEDPKELQRLLDEYINEMPGLDFEGIKVCTKCGKLFFAWSDEVDDEGMFTCWDCDEDE